MSILFAPELGDAVRDAAERAGMTPSQWLAEAARAKLRADAIDASVALLAGPGDQMYTSDPDDLPKLCGAAGNNAAVIGCY